MKNETSHIFSEVIKKTQNGTAIPIINKNGVLVRKLTIFEDICIRNKSNLDIAALEINGNQMTYAKLFREVERYIRAFESLGVKKQDIITLYLPVGVEFICACFALTTIGATCNAGSIILSCKPRFDRTSGRVGRRQKFNYNTVSTSYRIVLCDGITVCLRKNIGFRTQI